MKDISVRKTAASRIDTVDFANIQFGKVFSDHMFSATYKDGEWTDLEITPFENISMSPGMSSLHYGQAVFEGMKAYKNEAGEVLLFRPNDNAKRINVSLERMCMPAIPEEIFLAGLEQLLKLDAAWVPNLPDTSLYIRPFVFATDDFLGVRPSQTYRFMIITCPASKYYTEPIRVKIETQYVRSAPGGTGFAKAAGNYAASMLPTSIAQKEGYQQILWTDCVTHRYFEESGTMNVMFVIDGKLVTPKTSETILKGITRDSVLKIAQGMGIAAEERQVSIDEVIKAAEEGRLQEAFGTGTAVTISPFKTIGFEGKDYDLPQLGTASVAAKILAAMDDIKYGRSEDVHGWMTTIK
jgi:branched-chain amino acid aminotransferase